MFKRRLAFLLTFILVFSNLLSVEASPGRLDSNGGHHCWTNCEKYGLDTGEYHYHYSDGSIRRGERQTQSDEINVYINGVKQRYDQLPVVENNRTLVPLRGIFEALGAKVEWDQANQMVTATMDETKIKLVLGSKTPSVNGKIVEIDVPAKAINGRTLVPIRFVSESLGAEVKYNAGEKRIDIIAEFNYEKFNATVSGHVDGDTIRLNVFGNEESVRLLLIDTPETVHPSKPEQPFGIEASNLVKEFMPIGKTVQVELDISERDKYGRILAYLYVDGKMINELLIERGLARVAYIYAPNTRYIDKFKSLQEKAQKESIGIWSIENYVTEDGFNP